MKAWHLKLFIPFVCFFVSQSLMAQINELEKQQLINFLFQPYEGEKPGISVAVIKDGEIIFSKACGMANMEEGVNATLNTNYRIASVTKQFTALAILKLIEQKKLTLKTSLTQVFPNFPQYGNEITIAHLLTHQSGLIGYNNFLEEGQTVQMLDKDVVEGLLKTDSTLFIPGSKYSYSNTGYAVLAMIVEKISGNSFAEFMQHEVFTPIGMDQSIVYSKEDLINNRAFGYVVKDSSILFKDQSVTSAIQGDGGIYTSVMDYYKWDQALYTDQLVSQKLLKKGWKNWEGSKPNELEGYGFGWEINTKKQITYMEHGGSSTGFGSHVIRVPELKLSVVVFSNRSKSGAELRNLAHTLLSFYSNTIMPIPFEVIMNKTISKKGIEAGMFVFNNVIKNDSATYDYTKEAMFYLGIDYINSNKDDIAIQLMEQLIKDESNYFGGYYGKGIIAKYADDSKTAINNFQLAIKNAPSKNHWCIAHCNSMIEKLKASIE